MRLGLVIKYTSEKDDDAHVKHVSESVMLEQVPCCWTLLFVPAHVVKFIARAHTRGANAFTPSPELAAIEHQGVMADLPVALRAQSIIRRYDAAGSLQRQNK